MHPSSGFIDPSKAGQPKPVQRTSIPKPGPETAAHETRMQAQGQTLAGHLADLVIRVGKLESLDRDRPSIDPAKKLEESFEAADPEAGLAGLVARLCRRLAEAEARIADQDSRLARLEKADRPTVA